MVSYLYFTPQGQMSMRESLERGMFEPQTLNQPNTIARFSLSRLSIKYRLPLLIGILLLALIVVFTWASYHSMKNTALEVGHNRLRLLTQQLANMFQQSANNHLNRTHTAASDSAIRSYLGLPKPESKPAALKIMQQHVAPQEQNGLQVELRNADHSLALVLPENSPQINANFETELKQAASAPSLSALGAVRVVNETVAYPIVAIVKDDVGQKTLGYLVRWRKVAATPEARGQFMELLGKAELYIGNKQGDVWTNLVTVVPKPPADVNAIGDVIHYTREGKSSVTAFARPVAGTPWVLLVEFSDQDILAPTNRFLRRMMLVGAVLLVIGVVSALILSRSITRPLHTLTEASSAMARGDYSRLVEIRSQDELGELANAFNMMAVQVRDSQHNLENKVKQRTAELEAVNNELEAFSYSVSHDLRAPLRAINGFSRILLDSYSQMPDDAKRYLGLVCNNAEQMGRLIDDLLAFSRLSRQQIKKQQVSPEEVVRQVLDELQHERQGRDIEITIAGLPEVQADKSLLKQVYTNLISNALKYTRGKDKAKIEIGFMPDKEHDGVAVYYVKDNGTGFDMKYANKLFGVFQRLHRAEEFEGTGVGLAIVHRIIHRHNGRIWFEAEVDKGATFYFTLQGGNSGD